MGAGTGGPSTTAKREDWHEDISAVRALCCDFMRTFLPAEVADVRKSIKLCYTLMESIIQCMNYCIQEGDTIIQMHLLSLLQVVLTNGGREHAPLVNAVSSLRTQFFAASDQRVRGTAGAFISRSGSREDVLSGTKVAVLSASTAAPQDSPHPASVAGDQTPRASDDDVETPRSKFGSDATPRSTTTGACRISKSSIPTLACYPGLLPCLLAGIKAIQSGGLSTKVEVHVDEKSSSLEKQYSHATTISRFVDFIVFLLKFIPAS